MGFVRCIDPPSPYFSKYSMLRLDEPRLLHSRRDGQYKKQQRTLTLFVPFLPKVHDELSHCQTNCLTNVLDDFECTGRYYGIQGAALTMKSACATDQYGSNGTRGFSFQIF